MSSSKKHQGQTRQPPARTRLLARVILLGLTSLAPAGCGTHRSAVQPESFLVEIQPSIEAWQAGTSETAPAEPWQIEPVQPPPLVDIPYADIVNPERPVPGSLSLGTVSDGLLVASRSFETNGTVSYILRSHVPRQAHFATEELVDLIERTGARMAERFPGTRLALADASLQGGGDIRRHHSHTSGRDLDIPFFVQDHRGQALDFTRLVRFDSSGRSDGLVFDVERNWFLVRTLLAESDGALQWIFVSRPLIQLMLDHAQAIGEPEDLISHARDVLRQPSDSSPHDDHFHVRIYCSRQDVLEGCLNYGPEWPWAEQHRDLHRARLEELMRGMQDEDPPVRIQVIEFIAKIGGNEVGARLAGMASEQPPEVQLAILAALRQFGSPGVGREVVELFHGSSDPLVRTSALQTAATCPYPEASDLLAELLLNEESTVSDGSPPVSRWAAQSLLEIQEPGLVPRLIEALGSRDRQTRATTAVVLARTTGRRDGIDWLTVSPERQERAVRAWRQWYATHSHLPWEVWIREGFYEAGYPLVEEANFQENLEQLLDAVEAGEPIGYLAEKLLAKMTGASGPPQRYPGWQRRRYWHDIVAGLYGLPQ